MINITENLAILCDYIFYIFLVTDVLKKLKFLPDPLTE